MVDDRVHENEGHAVIDIDYASTQSRNFFPCKSENDALMVMLRKFNMHGRYLETNLKVECSLSVKMISRFASIAN